jgi:hypothetical protein
MDMNKTIQIIIKKTYEPVIYSRDFWLSLKTGEIATCYHKV